MSERVLVIKLGALGDFVHAFHGFAAVRAQHSSARVELLTTAPFAELARAAPWFDAVHIDTRPGWWNLPALRRLRRLLRGYDVVYDLQTSRRSGRYFRLAGRPVWSGIAAGCAYPHANPARDRMHTVDRQREQLAMAGVPAVARPERGWMSGRGSRHGVAAPYALLVPGDSKGEGSPKRWGVERFAAVARRLAAMGVMPVVIGGRGEAGLAQVILKAAPGAVDLTGRTTMFDIAALGEGAAVVVGNDTGPVHVACAAGGPTVALFSRLSSREEAAPRGPGGEWSVVLKEADLADLPVERVMEAVLGVVGGGEAVAEEEEEPAADR